MVTKSRLAAALETAPSSSFDRALTALLTGAPESLALRLTHGAVQGVLDGAWIEGGSTGVRGLIASDTQHHARHIRWARVELDVRGVVDVRREPLAIATIDDAIAVAMQDEHRDVDGGQDVAHVDVEVHLEDLADH